MRKILLPLSMSLLVAALESPAMAQSPPGEIAPPDPPPVVITPPEPAPVAVTPPVAYAASTSPSHVIIGNQQFDASLAGLRAYLETTKSTNAQMYAQLAPDLQRLESRATAARLALFTGLALGVVSTTYALVGGKDCPAPSATASAFAASTAAWNACNEDNARSLTTFGLIGMGSAIAGVVAWLSITPKRSELFDFMNKHNRLSRAPLRFQMGYDPAGRLAYGGAALAF